MTIKGSKMRAVTPRPEPRVVPVLPAPRDARGFLAVDKPAGVVVHGRGGLLADMRRRHGEALSLAHRLDRETSGVLLLARTPEALAEAHAAWSERVEKSYVALVRGVPSRESGLVDAPLLENRSGRPDLLRRALRAAYGPDLAGTLLAGGRPRGIPLLPRPGRTGVHPAGRVARTRWSLLGVRAGNALVLLVPETGRMHQIRVHLAHLGTPVLGDPLYDVGPPSREAMALHAWRLVWREPPGGGADWTFEAPLPPALSGVG